MSHLYVCNATPRHFHMNFRLPQGTKFANTNKVFSVNIAPGGQKDIAELSPGNKMDGADIEHIVRQIPGVRTVSEASAAKGFSGIIYSKLRPVDVDAIHQGLAETDQVAIDRALQARQLNSMASDKTLSEDAAKTGGRISPLEVEIQEEARPGDAPDTQLKRETIEVI